MSILKNVVNPQIEQVSNERSSDDVRNRQLPGDRVAVTVAAAAVSGD